MGGRVLPNPPIWTSLRAIESWCEDLFVQNVLIDGAEKLEDYLDADMIQHNPDMQDGVAGLRSYLEWVPTRHEKIHRVLAEGNFVLATRSG